MSQTPHVIRGARWGLKLGEGQLEDLLMVALLDTYCGFYMAQTAENLARKYDIGREAQDQFALLSQQRAAAAWEAGKFADEVVPVEIKGRKGVTLFERDDHLRPDTTMAGLARLRPAFSKDGLVTAGNASGIVDGAAVVIIADQETAQRLEARPMGRIVSWGVAGVPPEIMGIGPVPATEKALAVAGLKLADIDLVEVNEAFAGQYLAVEKELGLDRERTTVNGGAIALGHPLGASGTRLVLTVLHELRRRGKKYGLATACIGGGQGIAMIVEAF
jgi:acetyl-CoA acetyltransferase family protein